ncbi:MAG: hypothetical protein HRU19_24535 [Pseudobacteriovorax sp.]|nr:hypothetical protein [Pseudobacteriovorax sp.]
MSDIHFSPQNLTCPFPLSLHPQAKELIQAACRWEQLNWRGFRSIQAGQFAKGAAYAFPYLSFDHTFYLTQWACLCFLMDDLLDSYSDRPCDELRKLTRSWHNCLRGQRDSDGMLPENLTVWADSIEEHWHPKASERFLEEVGLFLDKSVEEIRCRQSKKAPSIETYVTDRLYTGATGTYLALLDLTFEPEVDLKPPSEKSFSKALRFANRQTCYANDIYSWQKEMEAGDVHNLIILISQHFEVDHKTARAIAINLHNNAIEQYLELRNASTKLTQSHSLARRFRIVESMMRGHLEFVQTAPRYK